MRHIEIVLGVGIMAAAVALAFGVGDAALPLPLPPIGFGGTLALILLGIGLVAHGLIGLRIASHAHNTTPLRVLGRTIFTLAAAIVLVVAVPALVAPLNLAHVAGFPLGYYAAAQGVLVALAILAFRAARGLDLADEGADPGAGDR